MLGSKGKGASRQFRHVSASRSPLLRGENISAKASGNFTFGYPVDGNITWPGGQIDKSEGDSCGFPSKKAGTYLLLYQKIQPLDIELVSVTGQKQDEVAHHFPMEKCTITDSHLKVAAPKAITTIQTPASQSNHNNPNASPYCYCRKAPHIYHSTHEKSTRTRSRDYEAKVRKEIVEVFTRNWDRSPQTFLRADEMEVTEASFGQGDCGRRKRGGTPIKPHRRYLAPPSTTSPQITLTKSHRRYLAPPSTTLPQITPTKSHRRYLAPPSTTSPQTCIYLHSQSTVPRGI